MKRHNHLFRYLISGFLVAVVLSLSYLFFGEWDFLGWEPEPLWARIVFLPGVTVGHLCYDHIVNVESVCRALGVLTMGIVGSVFGLLIYGVVRYRKPGTVDK